jgi:hypothetical protein
MSHSHATKRLLIASFSDTLTHQILNLLKMNSLKTKLFFSSFFLCCFISRTYAQTEVKDSVSGTYQIQVVNNRNQPFIPANINQIVIEHRKQNETVYYPLDNVVRIKILSRKEISAPGFQPLKQIEHVGE